MITVSLWLLLIINADGQLRVTAPYGNERDCVEAARSFDAAASAVQPTAWAACVEISQ